ncbi:hypothetical protein SUDANB121_00042 [Nocardiopsis dassonvillei]|uniref:transposase n=1 Tax=Nocardiopsis dassonvillei TaxID=2014 RepID=UPI003F5738F1
MSRTWAPIGQRPVLHVVKARPAKMSMAAACCYRRDHTSRLLFRTRPGWYHDRDLISFVDGVHRVLGTPVILVWDNLSAHRSRRIRTAVQAREWLEVEYLPAYAPDLNLVEDVWSHLKGTAPANLAELSERSGRCCAGYGTAPTCWMDFSLTLDSNSEPNNQTSVRSSRTLVTSLSSRSWHSTGKLTQVRTLKPYSVAGEVRWLMGCLCGPC